MKKHFSLDFKFWLNVFTFIALTALVIITWDQIVEAFKKLSSLNGWALLLMIPLQLASYFAVAKLYKIFLDSQGENLKLRTLYKVALELNFVNHVFPSGGVSGFSYLSLRLKQLGVSTAKSTLAQLLRFALTFMSFLIILLIGVFVLTFNSSTSALIIFITSTIILGTIFGAGIGIYIISNSSRIKSFVSWLPRAINAFLRTIRLTKRSIINIENVENTLEDLHKNYVVLRKDMKLIKRLLLWALLINIFEVATIYMVYVAFGSLINPGALIIAYAVANFAGLVAVLPGGVGIYEGLMTATLASAGVPQALALSATVIYRVLSIVAFLPIGYFYYHNAIRRGGEEFKEELKQLHDDSNAHA
ncbi:MAG: flippase-like domain-containing protein [bacterium]|nr:flippase-like domain-containing protein [bacterium]